MRANLFLHTVDGVLKQQNNKRILCQSTVHTNKSIDRVFFVLWIISKNSAQKK